MKPLLKFALMIAPLTLLLGGCGMPTPPPEPAPPVAPVVAAPVVKEPEEKRCFIRVPYETLQQAGLHPQRAKSVVFNLSIGVYNDHFDATFAKMLGDPAVKAWILEDLECAGSMTSQNARFRNWYNALTNAIQTAAPETVVEWVGKYSPENYANR